MDRLRIVAQSFADWLAGTGRRRARVLVGFDGRFGGERFALAAAEVLAANGFKPEVTAGPVPTPAVSWRIATRGYAAGLMITASHNPPAYSGVKVKPDFGGSPDETVIGPIVRGLGRRPPRRAPGASIPRVEFTDAYVAKLRGLADLRAIRRLRGAVVFDAMGGAQAGLLGRVLGPTRFRLVTLHDRIEPTFAGLAAPEPVEKNLEALKVAVRRTGARLGIATDGDGDRIALVADGGVFVSAHLVYALLLRFMVEQRGQRGGIVKTVSGSFLLDRIARAYGLTVHETPVGFKHICRLMRTEDILMGGEESGGVGFRGYIPERDGLYAGLLALELLATTGRTCRQLMAELAKTYGASAYDRLDVHHPTAQASLRALIARPPAAVAGLRVARVNTLDGLKLILPGDAWLLFRASGTEPLLRIYAESDRPALTRTLLRAGARLAGV